MELIAETRIEKSYLDTLRLFGEVNELVNELVNEAVEQYLTNRIIERIKLAREKVRKYDGTCGTNYATFSQRVQLDEGYHNQVDQDNPLWEQDTLEWMYWDEEVRDWTERLESILSES